MEKLQDQVRDICKLADAVIKDPSPSVPTTAMNIGICGAVANFAAGGVMHFGEIFLKSIPIVNLVLWIYKKRKANEIERQEKERMLREVIRKQQAVIRKLKAEQERNHKNNAQNRQEIENLKKMLDMLEKTKNHLNAA